MKITSAEVFVGGPGKNYVTLKIMTDAGIYGIGIFEGISHSVPYRNGPAQ